MNTSEVLNKAADLIEVRGWGHGIDAMIGNEGVCLMGAIHAATFGGFADRYKESALCPAGRAVYQHLSLDLDDYDAGWEWNDSKWTVDVNRAWVTAEPNAAVEVLRAAALIEAAKETADERESVTA